MNLHFAQTGRSIMASHFTSAPKTTFGWVAFGVAAAYVALAIAMARVPLGMPTWLDFTLGIAPGAVAAVLLGVAMVYRQEHSWLLWLAAIALVPTFGGWIAFLMMAL